MVKKVENIGWGDVLIGTHKKIKKYALEKPSSFTLTVVICGVVGTFLGSLFLFVMKGLWRTFW